MKKLLTLLLVGMLLSATACSTPKRPELPEEKNGINDLSATVSVEAETKTSPADGNITSEAAEMGTTYMNPIMDHTYENADQFGDPFIMRYNGMYYLYHSSSVLKCWSSEDMVNWTYLGVCCDDPSTGNSWAPEVKYYDGVFYLCTAPNGNGPYILTSDKPEGPFTYASGNLDLWFDSHMFIDDDGSWYLYTPHSGDTIHALRMDSTTSVEYWTNTDLKLNVADGAWTEGPTVIKHKDTYFMTYCGAEVTNPGYQIHYATSDGNLMKFTAATNYPILINTDKTTYPGLGHNSMVKGPNMDTLYVIYHAMPWRDMPRTLMIDPLFINGNYMQALGPTLTAQQAPEMPDIYSRFESEEDLAGWTALNAGIVDSKLELSEGGVVLSNEGVHGDFTAEYNFYSIEGYDVEGAFLPVYGKAGAIFDYTDENNYGAAYINTENMKLEVVFTVDGKETVHKAYLPTSFEKALDFTVLQTLTVKKDGSVYTFLMNDLTVGEFECDLTGGAFGVSCLSGSAKVGFVGITDHVWHSSYKEYYKPVEGELSAILCTETELNTVDYGGRDYLKAKTGETYNYLVNAEKTGNFDFGIKYRAEEDFSFELYYNGTLIYSGSAPKSAADRTEVYRSVNLTQGYGIFTFKITDGSADIFNYRFITSTPVTETVDFDLAAPIYEEAPWSAENGVFTTSIMNKTLYGDREWSDYSTTATFTSTGSTITANLLFRVTNESLSPKHSEKTCINYYLGYKVTLARDETGNYVSLKKINYNETELARYNTTLPLNTPITVTAEAEGEVLRVYLNGSLIIEYSDPDPFMKGAVGFADVSAVTVNDLYVEPIK